MNLEDFRKMFTKQEHLGTELYEKQRRLEAEIENSQKQLKELQSRLEQEGTMRKALRQLAGERDSDPGKYGPAYYFVLEIVGKGESRDIRGSGVPSLHKECPMCKKTLPVVMMYEQTYDSPDGDRWTKVAFTMCPVDGIFPFTRADRDRRFL